MTLWYDVSDLTGWTLPHLTGIQRTTVGILDGLVGIGAAPRLARLAGPHECFEEIDAATLPAAIREHLPWAMADEREDALSAAAPCAPLEPELSPPPAATPAPVGGRSRRRRVREVLYGSSPAAGELRVALREFKAAGRRLRSTLTRWTAARCREACGCRTEPEAALESTDPTTAAPPENSVGVLPPCPAALATPTGPLAAGDVLVSVGASWAVPGHAAAVVALRARGVRVVRMIYDLIPTLKPQWVDDSATRILTEWVGAVLSDSDRVLTISQFSRREIERYGEAARLALPPISVVRLGDVLPTGGGEPAPPRMVPPRPFFLCVSNLDIRKNHRLLYDAWSVLATRRKADCPDLVCVGLPNPHVADLVRELRRDPDVRDRIHLLHGVDDAELAWYYRSCVATVYASRYEGWGLPVAESLGHGRLCLASNATSIPEISPDLPAFFDPFDLPALVALIERAFDEPDWVRGREAEIRARFRPTLWRETAGQVLAACQVDQAAGQAA